MTADEFNAIAWRDFILWAWTQPDMRQQFTEKTLIDIRALKSPIQAAIDVATNAAAPCQNSIAAQFIAWATKEHWGMEYAPEAYRFAQASAKDKS